MVTGAAKYNAAGIGTAASALPLRKRSVAPPLRLWSHVICPPRPIYGAIGDRFRDRQRRVHHRIAAIYSRARCARVKPPDTPDQEARGKS